jgi:hypothetical protein
VADTTAQRSETKIVPGHQKDTLAWLTGLILVALFFLVFKMYNIQPYSGDESIYIAQGKLIAQGYTPYADFAMAHPPLQGLLVAFLFKTIGYQFEFFRMIPIFWCLLGGIVLAFMVRREYGSFASVAAMALAILSYEPLRASSHFTGVNMTIAILMMAFLAQRQRKILLCAVICVLAVFTRLYALPAVLALVLSTFLRNRNEAQQLVKYGAITGGSTFILIGLWTGFGNFTNDVFAFQAKKTAMSAVQLLDMRDTVFFHNAIPFTLFVLGTITLLIQSIAAYKTSDTNQKAKKIKKVQTSNADRSLLYLSVLSVLLILGILLNMNRVWMYYYVLAFPFGAIAGGWMLECWRRNLIHVFKRDGNETNSPWRISLPWLAGSIMLFAIAWFSSPRLEKKLDYYKERIALPVDQRTAKYVWQDGKLPAIINEAVKKFFWKEERVIGEQYSWWNYYLWHSSRILDITDEAVAEIRKRTAEKDCIFGDSGTVPLFSLLSGRSIAGREVDTNVEQYRSGNADIREVARKIDVRETKLILLRDNFGVAAFPEIKELVGRNYREVKSFRSGTGFTLRMYERLAD